MSSRFLSDYTKAELLGTEYLTKLQATKRKSPETYATILEYRCPLWLIDEATKALKSAEAS